MAVLNERDCDRLRWRARRGLLENDLIITRFLDAHVRELTDTEAGALLQIFELDDNELLDLLLGRKEPEGAVDTPVARDLIRRMREI